MNISLLVILFFLFKFSDAAKSDLSWLIHLKECLFNCYEFNLVLINIHERFKHTGYLYNQVISEISHNSQILVVPDKTNLSLNAIYSTGLTVLTVAFFELKNNTSSKFLQKIFYNTLRSLGLEKKYLIFIFRSSDTSSTKIENSVLSFHKGNAILKDLDLKILEIVDSTRKSSAYYQEQEPSGIFVHSYNYFTKSYSIIELSKIDCIFSKNVAFDNLNGRVLTMTLHPNPPSVDADFKVTGCYDPKTLTGPEGLILKAIAKSCNFTWRILASASMMENPHQKLDRAVVVNKKCRIISNFGALRLSRADIIGNFGRMPYLSGGYEDSLLASLKIAHIRIVDPLVVVVPILPGNPMNISEDFLMLLGFTIMIIIILKIAVKVMKFNNKFWTTQNIFRAIFGMGVTDSTVKISERIVLGCLFIISFFYSTDIINAIFDSIEYNSNRRNSMNLEQLNKAGITLMANKYYVQLLSLSEDPSIKKLAETAQSSWFTQHYDCVNKLVLKFQKNVSCLMPLSTAENDVRFSSRIHGEPNINILKDHVLMQWLIIYMSPTAVYDKIFQKTVQHLAEGGLTEKWYRRELMKRPNESMAESFSGLVENQQDDVISPILIKLGIGYVLSIFLLLGEIIVLRFGYIFPRCDNFNQVVSKINAYCTTIIKK